MGYPATLINMGLELAKKKNIRRTMNSRKHIYEQPLTYVKENNPDLFTERSKNLDHLKNNDRVKNILDTTKIIISKQQTKKLYKNTPILFIFGEQTWNLKMQLLRD